MRTSVFSSEKIRISYIVWGFLIFLSFIFWVDLQPGKPQVTYTAAIAFLMGFWWITEALPIGATSLLPLVLFPALGVLDGKTVSETYTNYVIFLYIGGFIMSLTIEKWNLHKRIALAILSLSGTSPFRILLGFMLATAFLSMWMSNTATAMMMLPMAFSVISTLGELYSEKQLANYSAGVLLSIAYASSIGGVATLVGTPPNLSFVRIYEILFPHGTEITFGNWLLFAFPIAFILLIAALLLLYFLYRPKERLSRLPISFIKDQYKALGKPSREEKTVFLLFGALIFLWIFRESIAIGNFKIPGWSDLLAAPDYINDGTVAIFIALLLFIIPSSRKNEALANWETASKIPWHIVLLFGGGFALAKAFIDSGLSTYIGSLLTGIKDFPTLAIMGSLTGLMTGLTEFMSNTAAAEMLLPIIGGLATALKIDPLLLMLPVTLASTLAFMLPIGTPPNTIVYGTGKLTMRQMVLTGLVLDAIAIVVITLFCYFWGSVVF